ncbi:MAG TPA: hypothetical protein VG943_08900 [Caulobacterales bacterium]|nr:hypothetical protein [Caulobacterales bacterium]
MPTTHLIALRLQDGRLSYASYKDEEERARILAWARANNAQVDPAPPRPDTIPLNHVV